MFKQHTWIQCFIEGSGFGHERWFEVNFDDGQTIMGVSPISFVRKLNGGKFDPTIVNQKLILGEVMCRLIRRRGHSILVEFPNGECVNLT